MIEAAGGTAIYGILGVIVLAVASALGLVFFVNKEEKFEDVVAAQKKEQEALLNSLQGSSKSSKGNKKWSKLKSKKSKKGEENEPEIDSGVDDEEPSSDSVVVPSQKEDSNKKQHQKKDAKKDHKPQQQKEGKQNLSKTEPVITKDDKSKEKSKKSKKPKQIVEEDVSVVKETAVQSAPEELPTAPVKQQEEKNSPKPQSEQSKKGKPTGKPKQTKPAVQKNEETDSISPKKAMSIIEKAQLNSSEVQQLIDVLLAKQNENEQWKKPNQKGNPVEMLKKQLSDVDMELTKERKLAQTAAVQNKDLKNELQQERSQRQNLEQVASQLAQKSKEHERARKHSEEKHVSEMQSAQAQISRMQQLIDGGSQRELHQLTEENKHLKNNSMRAQQLAEENKKLINDLNQLQQSNQKLHQEFDNTRIQFQQKEQHHISLQEKVTNELQKNQQAKAELEKSMSQNLHDIKGKMAQAESENKSLRQKLEKMEAEGQTVKAEIETMQQSAPPSEDTSKLSSKLLETEAQLSQAQSSMKELLSQVEQKNTEIQKHQNENIQSQQKIKDLNASTIQSKAKDAAMVELKKHVQDKEQQIMDLNKKNEDLSKDLKTAQESDGKSVVDGPADNSKLKELENALAETKVEKEKLAENVDAMKKKNNELREKNWKAMDALGKAEDDAQKKEKSLEKILFKSLKSLHPDLKLPKNNEGLEEFFKQYEQTYRDHCSEKEKAKSEQLETLRKENEEMKNELNESSKVISQNVDIDEEEINKMKNENNRLKSVLGETETMLSRLQAGVDAEVAKWQIKVDEKNEELQEMTKKLEQVKSSGVQNSEMEGKLKDTEAKLEEANKKMDNEVGDLNAKLKKTIAERDLLIREYKSIKDKSAKMEETVKISSEEFNAAADTHKKELKKLQDQVTALENVAKTSGKGDKEKDKIIGKLYLEIEELKEDLRDEREQVIVDIETPDSENLHKQLDLLSTELQQEKEDKFNLSLKFNDLEKSYQEEQSDKDKLLNVESKLKAAEAKIAELESAQSAHIQNQIEDAMKQKLSMYERDLEHEKQVNNELRAQLASGSSSGTTV